jgi:tetratricopeptide (TPR) repeat protein
MTPRPTHLLFVWLAAFSACSAPLRHGKDSDTAAAEANRAADQAPRAAPSPRPPPANSRPLITAEEMAELERQYARGIDAFEQSRILEAAGHLEAVYKRSPHFREAGSYLKRAYLSIGMEQYTNGDLAGAIRIWSEALRIDQKDEKALAYISRTRQELKKIEQQSSEKKP